MKKLLNISAFAALVALSGCASPPGNSMVEDQRTGTDYSPYRSIPSVLLCDDCQY